MVEIIPAILTDSSIRFKELIHKLEPHTDWIHLDVADGIFIPNKTVKGYEELKEIESAVKFDIHLMVQKPQDQLKEWFNTPADRFLIHAESGVNLNWILDEIHKHGRRAGLVLNPETEVDKVKEFFDKIDYIQFMTVYPGFQGQVFLNQVINKIAEFHNEYPKIKIWVDGGVTPETASGLVKIGASVLVSGSYIVKSRDIKEAIQLLKAVTSD